ncbi:SDR family NAD(P)-dependent oxidoreductase, partial [Streptomyces noursei]|uniref:SDR family NAD(P)-dependent oxidoreductase n=1 Tax=Streptomyces noursei TaxID=1971 RepID=UPI0036A75EC9
RDEERLREYAGRLGAFLERERVALADVAYTLYTGREPMTERLALVTADGAELVRVLREFANGGDPEGLLRGSVAPDRAPEAPQPTDDPHTAAAQWARGDTDDVAGPWTDGRRTPLPGYPFARERHWIATADGTLPGGTPALHPLLDANDSTVEEQRFRKTLRATDPLLRDHVIAGQPVLAAAAALELVRAGAERASRRPLRGLSDVVWGRPVTVPAGRAEIELYAAFTADGERIAFEVYSEADGARTTHLRGQVRHGAPVAEQADRTDLAAVRERCTGRRTGAEVYRDYAGVGFAYGDSFRVIQDVRIGRTEALAELALPAGAGHGCTLAPQLLDGALRACHWIDREQAPRAEELAVPFGVGALTVHGELPPVCYAHAEVLGRGERRDTWRYRVTVLDPEGRVLARVEDLVGRLFAAADVPESPADAPDTPAGAPAPQPVRTAGRAAEELFYRPVWHDAPAPRAGRADRAPLLVLTDRAGTAAELAAAGGWRQAVEVLPGAGFERRAADRYVLDPAEPEHYRRLLRELAADLPGASRAGLDVAHLWSTEAPDGGPQDAVEGDLAALHRRREEVFGRGLGSVLHLVRAVTDAGVDGRVRCLYLHSGRGAAGVPEHEAVAGLALSTARHAPGIELFTVRHDPARDGALPAAVLAAELTADGALRGAEVRYEAGRRSVRTVERATRPATPADGAAPLVEGGAYLITGGAGGVGRLLARYLAARYRARLVLLGRSPLPEAVRAELEELGAQVLGVRADVADAGQLRAALIEARGRFGGLDGVFHLAGVADRVPLTEVDDAGFRRALAAKVQGVVNLDVLTRADRLGVFAAFSSVSALCGDFGAGSYAAANRFLDAYLAVRDGRVASGERTGRTLSLDWPLWDAGGVDALVQDGELDTYQEATGMLRMTPRQALDAFDRAWQFDAPVLVPVLGDPERIARTLGGAAVPPAATRAGASTEPAPAARLTPPAAHPAPPAAAPTDAERYLPAVVDRLRRTLSGVLKLSAAQIDSRTQLDQYGIDSVMIMEVNSLLGRDFTGLRGTLLFEYRTVQDLAGYLVREHLDDVRRLVGDQGAPTAPTAPAAVAAPAAVSVPVPQPTTAAPAPSPSPRTPDDDPIAIIGMSGRYPQARNLEEFWDNLRQGRDCVTEVPADRWDAEALYDPDPDAPGKSYGRHGGFLSDVDAFDSLFFALSPRQAKSMDPQERLFLQTAWSALEDAGYRLDALPRPRYGDEGRDVGVFVGVMWDDYAMLGAEESFKGNHVVAMANRASIANQVSYFGDFRGPSVVIDTACSASLVALHAACESLRRDECAYALAGGVNVSAHPLKYVHLSRKKMLSTDGRCRSFGAGGNGYVPGEGVGAVVLKRLSRALADGDQVHAVIRATAVNHGGRTNGFTVPNPKAQQALVEEALAKAGLSARDIGCIEAHGTGTALGDPIEHTGLVDAFARHTSDRAFCALGSVKSVIGHLEGAAGIAGVTKAVLQLRHGELVPSLHAAELNPIIDFAESPFRVQREAAEWPREAGRPRRAGVSSFGAGGTNAHVILEEFVPERRAQTPGTGSAELVVLSARDEERLRAYADELAGFLERAERRGNAPTLAEVAHTLQTGREAFAERLAFTATDVPAAAATLAAFARGEAVTGLARGTAGHHAALADLFTHGAGGGDFVRGLARAGQVDKLAGLWVTGVELDWDALALERTDRPRTVSLPTYPFAPERHWLTRTPPGGPAAPSAVTATAVTPAATTPAAEVRGGELPLTLRPADPLVADHVVSGRTILPGAGYLDLVLDAVGARDDDRVIDDVYWLTPVVVADAPEELVVALQEADGARRFEVRGAHRAAGTAAPVHARGVLVPADRAPAPAPVAVRDVADACPTELTGAEFYAGMDRLRVCYGPFFRLVEWVRTDGAQALARLRLPERFVPGAERRALHPAVVDAALHTVAALHFASRGSEDLPLLPFAVDRVRSHRPVPLTGYAHITPLGENRYDVALLDDDGRVCVLFSGLSVREQKDPHPKLAHRPRWVSRPHPQDGPADARRVLVVAPRAADATATALAAVHADARVDTLLFGPDGPSEAELTRTCGSGADPELVYFLAGSPTGDDAGHTARAQGVLALVRLATALYRDGDARPPALKVVTTDVHPLRPDEPSRPAGAALLGLCSALAKEHPGARIACVDVRAEEAAQAARAVAAEPFPARVQPVLLRDGVRYLRTLERVRLPEPARPPLRERGVYAVIGGLGVIGFDTCLHLARTYRARLLVLGRAAVDPARRERLAQLEAAGAEVLYVAADAADPAAVRAAVDRAKERFGALHGVIHSVMDFATAPVTALDASGLHAALDSKEATVRGTWAAVEREPLDFLLFYSSGAAFQGAAGQGGYAAACCAADALALHLARTAPFPVKVVNWGFWHAAGVAEREEVLRPLVASGVTPLSAADGMRTVERFLDSPLEQVLALQAGDRVLAAMGVDGAAEVRIRPRHLPPLVDQLRPVVALAPEEIGRIESYQRASREAERLARRLLAGALRRMGVLRAAGERHTADALRARLRIADQYHRLYASVLDMLTTAGYLRRDGDALVSTPLVDDPETLRAGRDPHAAAAELLARYPEIEAVATLLARCLEAFPQVVTGEQSHMDVLFPGGSMDLVVGIYRGSALSDSYNALVARAVADVVRERLAADPTARLRILEVGSGTGSTSGPVLAALAPYAEHVTFTYTDITSAFVRHGRKKFAADHPFAEFTVFDVDADPVAQGIAPDSYDVVLGTNVFHVTPSIEHTMLGVKRLLRAGGVVLANEGTGFADFLPLIFGLTSGWWRYRDTDLRIPGSPLLTVAKWRDVLAVCGFDGTTVHELPPTAEGPVQQSLIAAESDGTVLVPGTAEAARTERTAAGPAQPAAPEASPDAVSGEPAPVDLAAVALEQVKAVFARVLEMTEAQLDPEAPFEDYGIDSLVVPELKQALEADFGRLPAPLLFEHTTIGRLADYFREQHPQTLARLAGAAPAASGPHRPAEATAPTAHTAPTAPTAPMSGSATPATTAVPAATTAPAGTGAPAPRPTVRETPVSHGADGAQLAGVVEDLSDEQVDQLLGELLSVLGGENNGGSAK